MGGGAARFLTAAGAAGGYDFRGARPRAGGGRKEVIMPGREWAPPGIDITKPNVARVYDYHLGGKDNFAADREVARQTLQLVPEANAVGRANRGFLRRAVRHMVLQAGIRQF